MLEVIEEHRAAVRYDLLRHGYRLEWLGTPRLPVGDAITLLSLQPPETSALYRVQFPEHYNRSLDTERLETIAVMLRQTQQLQAGVKGDDLATRYEDLFAEPKTEGPSLGKSGGEFTLEEMDALMGWDPVALGWK